MTTVTDQAATETTQNGRRVRGNTAAKPDVAATERPTLPVAPWEAETDGPFQGHNPVRGSGLTFERRFTTVGTHPYDEVEWTSRDVQMINWRDGTVNFEQSGVEFPTSWSINAVNIVTTKYFRGQRGTPKREHSLKQLIDRVVGQYVKTGKRFSYFATNEDALVFEHELTYMLLHQVFSFNSPVWFNVGWEGRAQQVSACFILSVDDTMDSILNWYREEGLIFKGGSGAGLNLSRIRSSRELLSAGGTPSGPVSFMRGADSSAATISSGGATRRAAKMVLLDVDHPDVGDFIETKAHEEKKIKALRDAGFDMDLSGSDSFSVQYQNANNSVRVSDEFMQAVEDGGMHLLRARITDQTWEVDARELFDKMARAAWECADPGVQYDGTINRWHTCPDTGRITASNPCAEYHHLDNSSCNLASFNLMKFRKADGSFDAETFVHGVELAITAMDISICFADFPTPAIADTTHKYRQLGLGYANIGAFLMSTGRGYDSEGGRSAAALITSLMQAVSARQSARLASVVGPYQGYERNAEHHRRVMRQHREANEAIVPMGADDRDLFARAYKAWDEAIELGERDGWRNSQFSVLAPTGTIGFMMDCDTTGIEPDFSLVKFKKLVGGSSMQIVNQAVHLALEYLGYAPDSVKAIKEYVQEKGHVMGAPGLLAEHYEVFDCAVGERAISPMGHVRMMAATQPFISGAISKTVNMPESATVEEVREIYFQSWKLGVKALAIYRDNCKVGQPLSDAKASVADSDDVKALKARVAELESEIANHRPDRRRLPSRRAGETISFSIAGAEGYATVGEYLDDELSEYLGRPVGNGEPGEVFIKMSKQGSTLAGLMDAFSVAISIGLQYGVPLETFVAKFINMNFAPAGITKDPDVRLPVSVMDYLFRRLAIDYLPFAIRADLGIFTATERTQEIDKQYATDPRRITAQYGMPKRRGAAELLAGRRNGQVESPADRLETEAPQGVVTVIPEQVPAGEVFTARMPVDAPLCMTCGTKMRPAGSCYVCEGCGSTSGCS